MRGGDPFLKVINSAEREMRFGGIVGSFGRVGGRSGAGPACAGGLGLGVLEIRCWAADVDPFTAPIQQAWFPVGRG